MIPIVSRHPGIAPTLLLSCLDHVQVTRHRLQQVYQHTPSAPDLHSIHSPLVKVWAAHQHTLYYYCAPEDLLDEGNLFPPLDAALHNTMQHMHAQEFKVQQEALRMWTTDLARLPELLCCRTATKISLSTRCICSTRTMQHLAAGMCLRNAAYRDGGSGCIGLSMIGAYLLLQVRDEGVQACQARLCTRANMLRVSITVQEIWALLVFFCTWPKIGLHTEQAGTTLTCREHLVYVGHGIEVVLVESVLLSLGSHQKDPIGCCWCIR